MEIFSQNFKVELGDIATNFGLKPTSIFKYYQETFARYCAKHNIAGYDAYKIGLKWVLGQTIVEIKDILPIWNEEVTAKVYISNIKKLRMYVNFEIETKRGIVAKGQSVAYLLDIETSRPQILDEIIKLFKLQELPNCEILKTNLESCEKLISKQKHIITFSDLDYNNHTNNISYLSFGCIGMPENYMNEHYPKILDIRYLQETFLDDVLICETYQNENNFEYKIIKEKDNSPVCIVKSSWKNDCMTPDSFFKILEIVKNN